MWQIQQDYSAETTKMFIPECSNLLSSRTYRGTQVFAKISLVIQETSETRKQP